MKHETIEISDVVWTDDEADLGIGNYHLVFLTGVVVKVLILEENRKEVVIYVQVILGFYVIVKNQHS